MKNQKGFTLIESIIYLALFTIIIGGGLVATYQIIQGAEGAVNHVTLQGEANFLFRKIDWALTGATFITAPYTFQLDVTKGGSLTFTQADGNITLDRGSGPVILNSSSIVVNFLNFQVVEESGKPKKVIVDFTLSTFQSGKVASQAFTMTKYLRQ